MGIIGSIIAGSGASVAAGGAGGNGGNGEAAVTEQKYHILHDSHHFYSNTNNGGWTDGNNTGTNDTDFYRGETCGTNKHAKGQNKKIDLKYEFTNEDNQHAAVNGVSAQFILRIEPIVLQRNFEINIVVNDRTYLVRIFKSSEHILRFYRKAIDQQTAKYSDHNYFLGTRYFMVQCFLNLVDNKLYTYINGDFAISTIAEDQSGANQLSNGIHLNTTSNLSFDLFVREASVVIFKHNYFQEEQADDASELPMELKLTDVNPELPVRIVLPPCKMDVKINLNLNEAAAPQYTIENNNFNSIVKPYSEIQQGETQYRIDGRETNKKKLQYFVLSNEDTILQKISDAAYVDKKRKDYDLQYIKINCTNLRLRNAAATGFTRNELMLIDPFRRDSSGDNLYSVDPKTLQKAVLNFSEDEFLKRENGNVYFSIGEHMGTNTNYIVTFVFDVTFLAFGQQYTPNVMFKVRDKNNRTDLFVSEDWHFPGIQGNSPFHKQFIFNLPFSVFENNREFVWAVCVDATNVASNTRFIRINYVERIVGFFKDTYLY